MPPRFFFFFFLCLFVFFFFFICLFLLLLPLMLRPLQSQKRSKTPIKKDTSSVTLLQRTLFIFPQTPPPQDALMTLALMLLVMVAPAAHRSDGKQVSAVVMGIFGTMWPGTMRPRGGHVALFASLRCGRCVGFPPKNEGLPLVTRYVSVDFGRVLDASTLAIVGVCPTVAATNMF